MTEKMELKGSTVLITGGTGTFGNAFLDICLEHGVKEARIFSRDEKKQYDMAHRYKDRGNVRFYLGDVRDASTLTTPMRGADFVFHAAAMKQVPSCEKFPMEAVKTNVIGSENVIDAAVEHGIKKAVILSTDKAVYPTSAMGMSKAYMEKIALQKASEQDDTVICVTRFGNLIASRGSAVPVFMEQAQAGLPITITDPGMTRFMMTAREAAVLVETAFTVGKNGDLLVKITDACTTGDLAKAVCSYLNLSSIYPTEIIGARRGEKMHESLLTDEEASRGHMFWKYAVVPMDGEACEKPIERYKSNEAKLMGEQQILDLIRTVFGKGET